MKSHSILAVPAFLLYITTSTSIQSNISSLPPFTRAQLERVVPNWLKRLIACLFQLTLVVPMVLHLFLFGFNLPVVAFRFCVDLRQLRGCAKDEVSGEGNFFFHLHSFYFNIFLFLKFYLNSSMSLRRYRQTFIGIGLCHIVLVIFSRKSGRPTRWVSLRYRHLLLIRK